jgi:MFS family permease
MQVTARKVTLLRQNLPWLYAGRALRSFITAFLTVIFPLYLAATGYSAARIGLLLTGAGLITLLLVAGVGLFSDAFGRRNAILGLALFSALGGAILALTNSFPLALLASGLGGVGRGGGAGSGGSWGPVFPAEQPLVAATAADGDRTRAFGVLSFVGVIAGAAGSLVAALPAVLHAHGWTDVAAYRLLFAVSAVLSLGMAATTLPIREARPGSAPQGPPPALSLHQLLGRLGLTNALNGLAMGFMGPLLTYWLYRRYGVGSAEIGVLYTVINLGAALPYLLSAHLARRLGAVRTVALTRFAGAVLLAAMPFMPDFTLAGALYTLRMMLNSLGLPARQSYVMGVSDERYRSRVSAFSSLPSQATAMISPAIGGALMDTFLDVPVFGAAFFMAANAVTYYLSFRNAPPPEERAQAADP